MAVRQQLEHSKCVIVQLADELAANLDDLAGWKESLRFEPLSHVERNDYPNSAAERLIATR